MHIRKEDQKVMQKEHFYGGEGTLEMQASIGFGGFPAQEGSNVMSAMRMIIPTNATVGNHVHKNAEELYVVLSGRGIHTTEGESYEVGPGDVINTAAGLEHSIQPIGDEPVVLQASLIKVK